MALREGVKGGLSPQSLNFELPSHCICVPRSRRRRHGAGRPTSLHSQHLHTGGRALTKTKMKTKALLGAATLQVAVAVTSTDWSSNVSPSLLLPMVVPQRTSGGPRLLSSGSWVGAGPVLKAGPSKGKKGREGASGTLVFSLKGTQRVRYRGETQAS